MTEAFFHTDCPSCGAPVELHSATAVTVVCSYCNSMLVYQDSSLRDTGRDSAVLHDFSPIQIGTTGVWQKIPFAVIGRLKAQYDAGEWNEWWIRFQDGSDGWLSEAGDLYVLVRAVQLSEALPEFDSIRAAETLLAIQGKNFIAADVREIVLERAQVQGELPFAVPERLENRVADFRSGEHFLTLDYADTPPAAFLGSTVSLDNLSLQFTRDAEQIRQSAGCLRGSRQTEKCPHCGSSIQWIGGLTNHVICPSCCSEIEMSEGKAQLRAAGIMRDAQQEALPLPLGTKGTLYGKSYTVIGAVYRDEISGDDARLLMGGFSPRNGIVPQSWWREYLLYSTQHGFAWLVETEDGWKLSQTQAAFPPLNQHGEPQQGRFLYDYGGRVGFAAGAFYWQIHAGDTQMYRDYKTDKGILSAEISNHELAWSLSTPVPRNVLANAFNLKVNNLLSRDQTPVDEDDGTVSTTLRLTAIGLFLFWNLGAWTNMLPEQLVPSLICSLIIVILLWRI